MNPKRAAMNKPPSAALLSRDTSPTIPTMRRRTENVKQVQAEDLVEDRSPARAWRKTTSGWSAVSTTTLRASRQRTITPQRRKLLLSDRPALRPVVQDCQRHDEEHGVS